MEIKTFILRIRTVLLFLSFAIAGYILLFPCPTPPTRDTVGAYDYIEYLYPWPGAKIPLACHVRDHLLSSFAPRTIYFSEDVFREDGHPSLSTRERQGVVVIRVNFLYELYHQFPEPVNLERATPFINALSLSMDGRPLHIGHIGFKGFDREFVLATVRSPLLMPGNHNGSLMIQLPSGDEIKYEWQFEITWW